MKLFIGLILVVNFLACRDRQEVTATSGSETTSWWSSNKPKRETDDYCKGEDKKEKYLLDDCEVVEYVAVNNQNCSGSIEEELKKGCLKEVKKQGTCLVSDTSFGTFLSCKIKDSDYYAEDLKYSQPLCDKDPPNVHCKPK